jgi:hypothetical protein
VDEFHWSRKHGTFDLDVPLKGGSFKDRIEKISIDDDPSVCLLEHAWQYHEVPVIDRVSGARRLAHLSESRDDHFDACFDKRQSFYTGMSTMRKEEWLSQLSGA